MPRRNVMSAIVLLGLLGVSALLRAQTTAPKAAAEESADHKWNNVPPEKPAYAKKKKAAPAPRRDLSGIWDALAEGGIQAKGAHEHPALILNHPQDEIGGQADENNTLHPLPYTDAGLSALRTHKPSVGVRAVGPGFSNDPVNGCDPPGFPRIELYDFREMEISQTKDQVLMLYELDGNYRIVWTDGRQFPGDPEPRWFGYSTGKWLDDYTFQVSTVGIDGRSWVDHAGRPHSADLKVEEQYHRVDYDTIELTMTITDPKYYSQPWKALDKFVLHRLPHDYDWIEYICSPSDNVNYNDRLGDSVSKSKQ
jgi:hypothetical protein